jgi:acyl carrier protein
MMGIKLNQDDYHRLKSLVFQHLEIDAGTFEKEVTQDDVSNWSSSRHLSLIMEIEAQFGVSFKIEEVVEMVSFDEIVNGLERKLLNKP